MRCLLLPLALALASTPASASYDYLGAFGEIAGAAPRSPNHARSYFYIGLDGRAIPRAFSRDDGYFQGRGGGVSIARGGVRFDYDRDYPYDFPTRWGASRRPLHYSRIGFISEPDPQSDVRPEPMCIDEPVRDRRSGQSTTVRVCR